MIHATPTTTPPTPPRPTRHDGEGKRGHRKGHATCGACTDEDTGSAAAHTHITIIMHGEREAKTTKTTTQLNRRYPAEQPAGVINRELFEAPGTRRSHNRHSQLGRASRPRSAPFFLGYCNFIYPVRLMKYMFPYLFFFCVLSTLARPHTQFSFPGV